MKSSLAVSFLALALSGIALVALLADSRGSETGESEGIAPLASPLVAPDAELHARLTALEQENRALRDRLALLEQRPAPPQRAPALEGFATLEDLEALRAELAEGQPAPAAGPVEPDQFKQQIAGTLAEIRKEEAFEKVRKFQDQRSERLEADVLRIEKWLDLTPAQASSMAAALLVQYEREAEVRRLWEGGAPDELLAERKRTAGLEFAADVSEFLDPEQSQTFWAGISKSAK